jgi:hypothetical protein
MFKAAAGGCCAADLEAFCLAMFACSSQHLIAELERVAMHV